MSEERYQDVISLLSGKRVEWYPSAGSDLQNIRSAYRPRRAKSPRPNVFIHTDWWYAEGDRDDFADEIKQDDVILRKVKEHPQLPAESHQFCVFAQEKAPNAGRCVEYEGIIKLDNDRLAHFTLVKIAMENEQFAAEFLLPNQICLEALVHKNCGWGCGGGATIPGTWMRGVLSRLKTKYFITDWHGMNGAHFSEMSMSDGVMVMRKTWYEHCRPGEYEAGRVYAILKEPPGTALRLLYQWGECWELGSPHGFVTCTAVSVEERVVEKYETTIVNGHEIPALNNFFDLMMYAIERRICVYHCPACWNHGFQGLCRDLGNYLLLDLIGKVTEDDLRKAEMHRVLHRWPETLDILVRDLGLTPSRSDSVLWAHYARICEARARERVRLQEELARRERLRQEELARRERLRIEEHARKVAEHRRMHLERQTVYHEAWEMRCKQMAGLSLEEKLKIIALDNINLPEFYPVDLSSISANELESVSVDTLQKVAERFAVLRRRDWRQFFELVQDVLTRQRPRSKNPSLPWAK